MRKLIAVDPGAGGGIAWMDEEGRSDCQKMPETLGDLVEFFRSMSANGYHEAVLEQVVGFIPGSGAGAMFSFGQSFGHVQATLAAFSFRVIEVRPAMWQKALSVGAKKDYEGSAWKRHLKEMAQKLYPHCHVTLKTADALLILEYGCKRAAL